MKRTQIAQRSMDQKTPLLLKFRINPSYMNTVNDILDIRNRSRKEEYELTKKREEEVGTEMAFEYNRTDKAGNRQGDTGTEMFENGKPGNAMSCSFLAEDIIEAGYNLVDIYSYQKEGDNMGFICFSFKQEKSARFPQRVTSLLYKLCNKSWLHTHIWDNPLKDTVTINPAHIMTDKTAPPIRMERHNIDRTIAKTTYPSGIYFTIG